MMTTVLPTPAPRRGRSFAFQKRLNQVDDFHSVSNISAVVDCSSKAGASGGWAFFSQRQSGEIVHGSRLRSLRGERTTAHGSGNGSALINRFHARPCVGRFHGNAAYTAFADVLLYFEDDVDGEGTVKPSLTTRSAS